MELKELVEQASAEAQKKYAEINDAFEKKSKEIEEALKDKVGGTELAKMQGDLNELGNHFDELQKQIAGQKEKSFNFSDQVQASLEKNADTFKKMAHDKSIGNVLFDVNVNTKAAGTMTTGNYTGGTIGLSTFDPVFARVVRRQPFLRQIVTTRPISSKYVAWAEQANPDGGAGQTAEGAAKTQADFDIVERNKLVEKTTAYIKVSKEALDDISFLRSEIDNELVELVNLKLDEQILGGDDASPNLKGIEDYATTYVPAGGFALGIDNANNFDVARAVVATLASNSYQANYMLINPIDAGLMDMVKRSATDGGYVIPPFYSADGQRIAGLTVIENPKVTAGNFVIGDFTKSNLAMREEINIQVGYDGNDFTNNLVTIIAECRAAHYIKTNHAGAFYKGTFATVKAAMETA